MSKTQTPPVRTTVEPSRRDPITEWLDLFETLVGLPKADRHAIRAELEDHLRTRVDDLLITGLTEAEAAREAVTELGETLELARAVRTATRTNRRRFIMHATIIGACGAAITVGALGLLGPSQHASEAATAIALAAPDPVGAGFNPEMKRYDVSSLVFANAPLEITDEGRLLEHTIMTLVTTDHWETMGGDVASMKITGNTMFVSGPTETHEGVAWVIEALEADADARRAERADAEAREQDARTREIEVLKAKKATLLEELDDATRDLMLIQMDIDSMYRSSLESGGFAEIVRADPRAGLSQRARSELTNEDRLKYVDLTTSKQRLELVSKELRTGIELVTSRILELEFPAATQRSRTRSLGGVSRPTSTGAGLGGSSSR